MKIDKKLNVLYKDQLVGTLAQADYRTAFEYADGWVEHGFSISPFSLPLEKKVFLPKKLHFQGLFGVFADSLPDAWGNVLLNRVLKKNGIKEDEITPLTRLAIVGRSGMGALTYEPEAPLEQGLTGADLDELAQECQKILHSEYSDKLDELYRLGGTSGGARPKIMTNVDGEEWIIKFPAHIDSENIGKMEYDYSQCAKKCGIIMTDTKLFDSKLCDGYFGIKRFDRVMMSDGMERKHMITAAALLELDFNQPCMDYHSLMKMTKIMTRDNKLDVENMFRRMCFNVFAHNRDDHAKNFTFLYEEKKGWRLSPAYDLTHSNTYFGEQTTTVDGEGARPTEKHLLKVGLQAGLGKAKCYQIMEEVHSCVSEMLEKYL